MIIVRRDYLALNPFSRPGSRRTDTYLIVMHWTGNAMQAAAAVQRYFDELATQDPFDTRPDRYASAHYVVGLEGEIYQIMPEDEVAYHCGASTYTADAREELGVYCSATSSPNWCSIGIELCHPDWTGRFRLETLEAAAELAANLAFRYRLPSSKIWRHHDITGKRCPRYWVNNDVRLDEFRREVDITLKNVTQRANYGESIE